MIRPKDAAADLRQLDLQSGRRRLLRGGLSLGALTMLTGCNLADGDAVDRALFAISRWNDRVQAALFDPNRLAPTYTADQITKPFPFNAYYPKDQVRIVDGTAWRLQLGGDIAEKRPWSLTDLRALPQASQITRHICVEGWSAIGQWSGVPFRTFLERVGANLRAPFVVVQCADDYFNTIDMATALHPQTILALDYGTAPLPPAYGFPVKLRIPTKLGFKNPKHIVSISVGPQNPGGYWENQGYNWFSGS